MQSALNPDRLRIQSVDLLRGIVMIIMALDHVRLFMGPTAFDPVDPSQSTIPLFFTRWITHFCAPVFVFLAGTSAFLYARNTGCDKRTLRNFLFTRGLWIILVEIFLFNLVAQFLPYQFLILQVLWVIGWSMIVLAGLIFLPRSLILLIGLLLVFGHNSLDYFFDENTGWLYAVLHRREVFMTQPIPVFIHYPILPWPGVMALGYYFGRVLVLPPPNRNAQIWTAGLIGITLFLILRTINYYGDPHPWEVQERGSLYTVLSVLNTEKYPPSLLFILMTLGPALLIIPWLEKWQGWKVRFISIFGKVPFFFYLVHFLIVHLIAIGWSDMRFGRADSWWLGPSSGFPENYQLNLQLLFITWLAVIIICYPLCRWYANYKRAHREMWWLSYM